MAAKMGSKTATKTSTITACIYTRVSTQEQAKEGYSIEEQEKRCMAAIEAKGWKYGGTYSDPGVSGMTMEREGLEAMMDAATKGKIGAVVVYKLDRLSRRQRDTLTIIEDCFVQNDIILLSLSETLDTSTAWGRAMIGILSSFNQMECENIQMRTRMGREAKAREGGYAGGKPPLGYKSVDGKLVVIPEEAEVVRKVFALRREGETLAGIARSLNLYGYRARRGGEFKTSVIHYVLSQENFYRGIYQYGECEEIAGQYEPILTDDD